MSLNDPQWGKRGNSGGPPDLDEIWRNVNRRLNDLFGRKGGGSDDGGGSSGGPPRRGMALQQQRVVRHRVRIRQTETKDQRRPVLQMSRTSRSADRPHRFRRI